MWERNNREKKLIYELLERKFEAKICLLKNKGIRMAYMLEATLKNQGWFSIKGVFGLQLESELK